MKKVTQRILAYILDFLIITFSYVLVVMYRDNFWAFVDKHALASYMTYAIWVLFSLLSRKCHIRDKKSAQDVIRSTLKTNFVALSTSFILIVLFKLPLFPRFIIFGMAALTSIVEIVIFLLIYYSLRFRQANPPQATLPLVTKTLIDEEDEEDILKDLKQPKKDTSPYSPSFSDSQLSESVIVKLWQKYLDKHNALFDYISERINLTKFSEKSALIINSATYFNIEHIEPESQQLFINLHKINDFRRVNLYFIKVNENLVNGGVFVCCAETTAQRHNRFMTKYGALFGKILYSFDFLFRRVSPKIPVLQGLYFGITNGRDRTLSETEILGRLYFCGFELVGHKEIDKRSYFIVKKVKEPSRDEHPSYGPLIKLKRVGKEGKLFNCYKLRTMHPYSEYLQEYIQSTYSIGTSGKFANDFRITSWGLWFRKLWLDELPQFYNLAKGDVKVIGVRAVSPNYLKRYYPENLVKLRNTTKPGLIPVYTADKSQSLQELLESEEKYLLSRQNKPIITDIKYFSKSMFNIVTRRVKSLDNYR
ncbi:MAG: sugar transferase [Candidatus Cloacimonas sp.]|nr:sugar transferase [Candidatus Cloacimonadota bacterium]